MKIPHFCLLLLGILIIGTLSGCASMFPSQFRQVVLVNSQPPGAKILENGKELGVTPAFVKVLRGKHQELQLQFPNGETRPAPMKPHYRWFDSFLLNGIWLTLAPVGWGLDYFTGTAWRLDDPPMVTLPGSKPSPDIARNVAVAPPEGVDPEISDTVGELIESKIKSLQRYNVSDYNSTASTFFQYGSATGLSTDKEKRNPLFYDLGADHIFTSKVSIKDDGFVVAGRLQNVFTGEESGPYWWEIKAHDAELKEDLETRHMFSDQFHILPNTLELNLANYQPSLAIAGTNYAGKGTDGHSWYEEVLHYVSFIGLSHVERPRSIYNGIIVAQFGPSLNLSAKKISFDNYKPLAGAEFKRFLASAGYGVEFAYLKGQGKFFFSIYPALAWTRLHVRAPATDIAFQETSRTSALELGYSRFLNDHIALRLYTRTITEDSSIWKKAVRSASHGNEEVDSLRSTFVGVALGYVIPASIHHRTGWQMRDTKAH